MYSIHILISLNIEDVVIMTKPKNSFGNVTKIIKTTLLGCIKLK
jgi:hypothetical protein